MCASTLYDIPFICLLFFTNFRTLKFPLTWSRNSCAVYAPLKSTFTSIPQPYMTLISCPWWVHCNISLTSPATLEHLEFNIRFRDYINFNSYRFYDNLRDADVWSHLDSIVTHPAGSRLRVDINIDHIFRHNDHWEELGWKAVVDGLPLLRKSHIGGKMEWTV